MHWEIEIQVNISNIKKILSLRLDTVGEDKNYGRGEFKKKTNVQYLSVSENNGN